MRRGKNVLGVVQQVGRRDVNRHLLLHLTCYSSSHVDSKIEIII